MAQTAISIENIGKKYRIQHKNRAAQDSLAGAFTDNIKSLFKPQSKTHSEEDFWAIKDISLEINQGDRVGVIGRNGAGKSTLLKVLSRIVKPTTGKIEFTGRMASLLEVGTGFHGDLSGRENIYLNGSILGMSKREIDAKFDEIVAFSEIEKFLDTPVKRYSSGMYVRLAFAIAAHLEPDILIVDEVLAVGDAEFQKKCMGKMEDVSTKHGRTILFVSHQLAAVQNLCNKGLYLKNGQMVQYGKIEEVIPSYLKAGAQSAGVSLAERTDRSGNGQVIFKSYRLLNEQQQEIVNAQCGSDVYLEVKIEAKKEISNYQIAVGIDNDLGVRVTHLSNETTNQLLPLLPAGTSTVKIKINRLPLRGGLYSFTLFSSTNGEILDWLQDAGKIDVENGDFYRTGKLAPEGQGMFYMDYSISIH